MIQPLDESQRPSQLHGHDPWRVCEVALKTPSIRFNDCLIISCSSITEETHKHQDLDRWAQLITDRDGFWDENMEVLVWSCESGSTNQHQAM